MNKTHGVLALKRLARMCLALASLFFLVAAWPAVALAQSEQASVHALWVLTSAALVFFMQCGFLCLEVGSVQPKAATITALKNVVDWVVAAIAFWLFGWGLMFGHSRAGWFGTDFHMLEGAADGGLTHLGVHVHYLFQLAFAGTAATIVSGALAERTSFAAYAVISIVVTAVVYPLFGHWAWGNSFFPKNPAWLADLGFYDFAGSTVVHSVGGWVSLVGIACVGARIGRFDAQGTPRELPTMGVHWNALATLMLWFSWWGFNGGSTLLLNGQVGPIIVNTNLGAACGGIGAIVHCGLFEQRRGLSGKFLNGILAGLVGITAGCSVVSPLGACLIGLVAGVIANLVATLLLRFRLDDPVGAVPVHLGGGTWGTLAVGLFATQDALVNTLHRTRWEQVSAQLIGIAVCCGWVVSTAIGCYLLIGHYLGLRVSPSEELEGFDMSGVVRKPAEAPLSESELYELLGGDA